MSQVVFITGGASGIGLAAAHEFASRGARLALLDINAATVESAVETLRAKGTEVLPLVGDLADLAFAESAIRKAATHFGRLDVLVNNAAWRELHSMRRVSLESWEKTLRVCLTAPAFLSRWAAELMAPHGAGVIVNISSIRAFQPDGQATAYSAAKGGLDALTYDLASLYGPSGIRVVAISPGAIDTPLSQDYKTGAGDSATDEIRTLSCDQIPLGRWGQAADIARAICWVASSEAAYLTGTTLVIDGGWTHNATALSLKRRLSPEDFP